MKHHHRQLLHLSLGACLLAANAAPAPAADRDDQSMAEIVVTATKRSERLIDVPESIQALSAQDLEKQGSDVMSDYARSLAGVTFTDRGPGQTQLAIRGISGGVDLDVGPESTVGVYIDEVPISEGMAQPDLRIVDIERVELLRGPQGTLYGSGSMGGTLRIITPKPDLETFSGTARTTVSDTQGGGINFGADATVNLPLSSDRAALRLSGYYRNESGFIDDIGTHQNNENSEHTSGGRAQIRLKLAEEWVADASVIAQRSRYASLNGYDPLVGDLKINLTFREPYDDDLTIGNVTLAHTGSWFDFVSSTSYVDRERTYVRDASAFLGTASYADYAYGTRVWTQEFRISSPDVTSKLHWVAGVYYSRTRQTFDESILIPGLGPSPGYPDDVIFAAIAQTTIKQSAIFANAAYEFAPNWTFEAGLRVAHPSLSTDRTNYNPDPDVSNANRSSTQVLPKANLSYKLTPSSTLYAQVAKGYRIGGGNIPVPPNPPLQDAPTTFGSDTLWNYELGAKSEFLEGRGLISGAVFYIDWKGVPVQVNRADGYSWFANAGNATSKGAELQASFLPLQNLKLEMTTTYLDATLNQVAAGVAATPGDRLPAVARWSGSSSAELTLPWSSDVSQFFRVAEQYVGGSRTDFGAVGLPMGNYWLTNFRTGVNINTWDAELFVNNLTNRRAVLYVNQFGGDPRYEINRPRTVGFNLRYKF
jgi:iron complex outermembrane recepter protein